MVEHHLHAAVSSFAICHKTVEMLIQKGAKINAKDLSGITLHGRSSIVDILLRNGASLKIRNQDGLTSLECALKRNALLMNHNLKHTKVLFYSGVVM